LALKAAKTAQLREILNAMLPPRVVNGATEQVSMKPVTREDVIQLQIALDDRLQLRQARETGICPVREELYSQAFDELIRQVTIDCPERGLLLLRIRDEAKMTIAAYETLYESSIVFGIRKSLQAEIGAGSLAEKIIAVEEKKKALKSELENLKARYETIEKQDNERRAVLEKKRQEEEEFVKFQQQHLEAFLKQTVG
jgi:dynein light intermediate chain, axonemal